MSGIGFKSKDSKSRSGDSCKIKLSSKSFSNFSTTMSFGASSHDNHHLELRTEGVEEGVRALWRAVILQAIMDASSVCKKQESKVARRNAINWLNISNENFIQACQFAGLPPSYVVKKSHFAIANTDHWKKSCRDLKIHSNRPVRALAGDLFDQLWS